MSHKTFRGQEFNMAAFADQNGHVPALGNSNRNARGDVIDRSGKVIATAQQVNALYNNKNPKAVAKVSIKKDVDSRLSTQAPKTETAAKKPTPPTQANPADIIVSKKTITLESGEEKTEITYADGSVEIV